MTEKTSILNDLLKDESKSLQLKVKEELKNTLEESVR
jgi:hypothetical protein